MRKAGRLRNFPRFRRHCVLARCRRRAIQKASRYGQKEPGADYLPSGVLSLITKGVPVLAGLASGPFWGVNKGKGSKVGFSP
jgi:hypothetical protein